MHDICSKPWGVEELLESNDEYAVKRITMFDGQRCSSQYHKEKRETIYVLSGELTLEVIEEATRVAHHMIAGEFYTIDATRIHRMSARNGDVVYLEASSPKLDDVVRIEDDYDRV